MLCCRAICVLHVNMQCPDGYSRMADVSMSMLSIRGSRVMAAGNAYRLLAEDHARRLDGIAADIEQRAAAVRADVAYVVGIQFEIAERAHRGTQLPDASGAHQFHNAQPLRVVLHHEAFADLDAGAVAHRHQFERFLHVQCRSAFRRARACLPRRRAWTTAGAGDWAADCRPRRSRDRPASPRRSRRPWECRVRCAAASARARVARRDTHHSLHSPACIAGMTRVTAIFATPEHTPSDFLHDIAL